MTNSCQKQLYCKTYQSQVRQLLQISDKELKKKKKIIHLIHNHHISRSGWASASAYDDRDYSESLFACSGDPIGRDAHTCSPQTHHQTVPYRSHLLVSPKTSYTIRSINFTVQHKTIANFSTLPDVFINFSSLIMHITLRIYIAHME